jgi:hypothetical protein
MSNNVKLFPVNLQQGFITDIDGRILAAYSHHNKAIVTLECLPTFGLPEPLKGYTLFERRTDGFGIEAWTNSGTKGLHEIVCEK